MDETRPAYAGRGRVMTALRLPQVEPRADVDAEQVVLGGCLWDTATLAAVRTVVGRPQVFYRPAHQQLFAALCAAADAGEPTDPVGIWQAIAPNKIPGVDGVYLHTLLERCSVPTNAVTYAVTVVELARLRHWQLIGHRLLDRASSPDADADEVDAYAWAQLENAVLAHEGRRAAAATVTGRESETLEDIWRRRRGRRGAGYAAAALRGEVDRVLAADGNAGKQLAVVTAASKSLRRLIDDGSLTEAVVTRAIAAAAASRGLDAGAVGAALHTGIHLTEGAPA
ncbi:MAG: hypothetical protein GEU83_20805 [Pseudonocardiaceae bacterium]|nr:hypothetical protein [Pseudonocardiaceae bacterium]